MCNNLCVFFCVLRNRKAVVCMSATTKLGLTHPSILDALVEFYQTETYRDNVSMRNLLNKQKKQLGNMQDEIEYLHETCALYARMLRPHY